MPNEARTRVLGYVRISPRPDEGVSIKTQRAKIEAYAVAMDLDVVAILEEPKMVSAKSMEDRPALADALARLERGEADGLLVTKLDRLTRSVRDLATLIETYFGRRFALLSVGDSIDTRTATGRLVVNVLGSIAQWEREATGERTRDALAQLRREGVRLGAEAMGWKRLATLDENRRRIVVAALDEVAAMYRIHQLREAGLTTRAIAAKLEEEGHRPKRSHRWNHTTVQRVLARGLPPLPLAAA